MTENKRFYIKQSESTGEYPVFDRLNDDECVAVSDVERVSQKTCDLLNKLSDENEQLKKRLSNVQTLYKSTDDNLFACRETNNELRECYSKLEKENEQLKKLLEHSHCRKCIHFSCDSIDNYCMKKGYDSISDCNIAEHCTDYESVFE